MTDNNFGAFSSGPRYAQLAKTLFNEIKSGKYAVGELLPTEFELCAQFGVSRFTVREAFKQLVQQGLIVRQPGVGSRVISRESSSQYTQTMSGITDLRQYATETTLDVLKKNIVVINDDVARMLGVGLGETWLHIEGMRSLENQTLPICLTEVYVAPRFRSVSGVSGPLTRPIYQMLEEQFDCKIKTVHQEIQAINLTAAMAKKLDVPARTCGLWIARRYMDERDELVEMAISIHPSGRFSYRESFRRDWQIKTGK